MRMYNSRVTNALWGVWLFTCVLLAALMLAGYGFVVDGPPARRRIA